MVVGKVKRKIDEFKAKKQQRKAAQTPDKITADATKWMMRFTLVLAGVGILTLVLLKNQLREMHESGSDTHSVQRAFIYIDGFTITRVVDPGKPEDVAQILIAGNIKNSGTTPGVRGKYYINSRFGTPPTRDDYPEDYGENEGFYPPQASQTTNAAAFPLEVIQQVQLQRKKLFVYGWIKYRDVFDGTKPHITKFCSQLLFDQTPILPASMGQVMWHPCDHNNCTDEQCQAN